MSEQFNDFLAHIATFKKLNTAKTYKSQLKTIVSSKEYKEPVTEAIVSSLVNEWKLRNTSDSTIQLRLRVLKLYLEFRGSSNIKLRKIVKEYKATSKIPDTFTEEQYRKLMDSIVNAKHRLLCLLMGELGLRISEALDIRLCDVGETMITIRNPKNSKDRIVGITKNIHSALRSYLMERHDTCEYLFTTPHGKYAMSSAQEAVKKLCIAAGVPNLHSHSLRHRFASVALTRGIDVGTLRDQLGHSNISVTNRYTTICPESRVAKVNAVMNEEEL